MPARGADAGVEQPTKEHLDVLSPGPSAPTAPRRRARPGDRRPTPDAAHSSGPSTAPLRAPSVHDTEPWRFELSPDRLVIRADRTRQLTTLDPMGRELVQSVGAALFNARVALAARGWAAEIDRLPVQDDPDVLAVVRPVPGSPDAGLAALLPAAHRRRTNRRRFAGGHVPDEVVRRLTEIAERDGVLLVPVVHESHRRLVARLTRQADRLQNADPAYRAELRTWTTRACGEGDGVPAAAVAPVDRGPHEKTCHSAASTPGATARLRRISGPTPARPSCSWPRVTMTSSPGCVPGRRCSTCCSSSPASAGSLSR